MFNLPTLRALLVAGVFCATTAGAACAQNTAAAQRTSLAALLTSNSIGRRMQANASPIQNLSLRGGVMFSPRGAGVAGLDFDLPTLSLGNGWHGRLDADVIFKANLGGINTAVPVTFDQLYYSPNAAGGHNVYYGGGVGVVLGGDAVFDGKLVLGTELTSKVGAELNVHFTEEDTLVCILGRLHF
jgi:hypothetical protein